MAHTKRGYGAVFSPEDLNDMKKFRARGTQIAIFQCLPDDFARGLFGALRRFSLVFRNTAALTDLLASRKSCWFYISECFHVSLSNALNLESGRSKLAWKRCTPAYHCDGKEPWPSDQKHSLFTGILRNSPNMPLKSYHNSWKRRRTKASRLLNICLIGFGATKVTSHSIASPNDSLGQPGLLSCGS